MNDAIYLMLLGCYLFMADNRLFRVPPLPGPADAEKENTR